MKTEVTTENNIYLHQKYKKKQKKKSISKKNRNLNAHGQKKATISKRVRNLCNIPKQATKKCHVKHPPSQLRSLVPLKRKTKTQAVWSS